MRREAGARSHAPAAGGGDGRLAIKRQTLASQVYAYLKEAILLDELHAGERLNEVEIAKRLGVSPTPVREAINKLKGDGIVGTDARQGCFIRDYKPADIRHLIEIRFVLERLGLEQGVPLMCAGDRAKLQAIQDQYELAYRTEPVDRIKAARSNAAFHQFFAVLAGNEWLSMMLANLDTFLHVVRAPLTRASDGQDSIREHRAIIAAAAAGDTAAAIAALQAHLFRLRDEVLRAQKSASGGAGQVATP